jgi:C_GCAxxG_C_C family probable redox protein
MESGNLTRRKFICSSSVMTTGLILNINAGRRKKCILEIQGDINELTDRYLPVYKTCSQTAFHALNEVFNLKADVFIRALAPFPGIALRGETCGAVSGSLCAIALVYESKKPGMGFSAEPSSEFCKRFEEKFGQTRCRDVIRYMTGKDYTVLAPEDYNRLNKDGALNHCGDVIKIAAGIAADIILQKS